jgi:hypothetical protein
VRGGGGADKKGDSKCSGSSRNFDINLNPFLEAEKRMRFNQINDFWLRAVRRVWRAEKKGS